MPADGIAPQQAPDDAATRDVAAATADGSDADIPAQGAAQASGAAANAGEVAQASPTASDVRPKAAAKGGEKPPAEENIEQDVSAPPGSEVRIPATDAARPDADTNGGAEQDDSP